MWDTVWNDIFARKAWGAYPSEDLVRFVARNFFAASDRSAVKFLEVGCGPGANLMFLAREGFSVTGIDGSQVALHRAAERLEKSGLSARLDCDDAMNLPYPDGHFDCVIDIECIYANKLDDARQMIAEAHRVLKRGGLFFSKTFASGCTGEGSGPKVEGELRTYSQLSEGPLQDHGLVRFTAKEEIPQIYGAFSGLQTEWVERSDRNGSWIVREWLISGMKA